MHASRHMGGWVPSTAGAGKELPLKAPSRGSTAALSILRGALLGVGGALGEGKWGCPWCRTLLSRAKPRSGALASLP